VSALSRQYAKLCDLRDFEDPRLLGAIRSLVPERDPRAHIERKVWEFAMVMLFLEEAGHLDHSSRVLSVGAGDERVVFWLTNHVAEIVATDIYGEGKFAHREAGASMLTNPAAHAPAYAWRPERLTVLHMDGRTLQFPDESFDAVFTVSSIEHFGSHRDIAQAAKELGRVLRPGGHAIVITECAVRLHPLATVRRRAALREVFSPSELERLIVAPSGLRMMQPLDLTLSAESWENLSTPQRDGSLSSTTGEQYPLILVSVGRSVFTSVCLVLVKPGPDNPGTDASL
jgi:ubiquinone/menaquinone biosynthesis C-methylase UbiE